MWETRHSIADWNCFKTQTLLKILRTQNQPQEVSCVLLEEEYLSQSVGCATNKLLSRTVPQNLKSFLCWITYGLLALDLWDIVIEVLRSTNNKVQSKRPSHQETGTVLDSKTKTQHVTRRQKVDQLSGVDYVPTNTHSSQGESQFFIFKDNEAVIKMVIKDRSPTMRRVFRIHRVALDCLIDRINLESIIQIKFADTKKHFTDILTKGSFSKNGWNHLLCLFNLMNFSMYTCSHFKSFLSKDRELIVIGVMFKRGQEAFSNDDSSTAKANPGNLVIRSQYKTSSLGS